MIDRPMGNSPLAHITSTDKLLARALPAGVDAFIPVAEFLDAKHPSGRKKYCSRAHLYRLKEAGKVRIVYSLGKGFVDMVSWFSHLQAG